MSAQKEAGFHTSTPPRAGRDKRLERAKVKLMPQCKVPLKKKRVNKELLGDTIQRREKNKPIVLRF